MAITMETIYDEIKRIERKMVTKKDLESLKDTIEIMSNTDTMRQLSHSAQDIKKGRVKGVTSVKDLLSEL